MNGTGEGVIYYVASRKGSNYLGPKIANRVEGKPTFEGQNKLGGETIDPPASDQRRTITFSAVRKMLRKKGGRTERRALRQGDPETPELVDGIPNEKKKS